MAELKSISQLPTQATASENDLFEVAVPYAESSTGYTSKKESLAAIADEIVNGIQYSIALQTTSKKIVGAINELKGLVELIPTFAIEVVQTLPVSDISETTIYLVPSSDPDVSNAYEEYIYVNQSWELVGTTAVDLSAYYTSAQTDTLLALKANTADLAAVATSGSYSDLSGKPTIDTELDDESTNAVQNKAIYSGIVDRIKGLLTPKDATITDGIAVIDDADMVEENPLKSLVVSVEGYQEGSGDPSPSNVRPIHGWTGANVTRCGINLWDEEWVNGYYNVNTGVIAPNASNICNKNHIPCRPNSQYYWKVDGGVTGGNYIIFYDKNDAFLSSMYLSYNRVINVPANAYYLSFSVMISTYTSGVGINYPSTDKAYHSYNGTTYPISWQTEAGEIYSGTLDVINGVLTAEWGIVDMGTLTWAYNTASGRNYFSAEIADSTAEQITDRAVCICSCYKAVPSVSIANLGEKEICKTANAQNRYFIKDADYTDAESFTTAVSGEMLAYELATPIEYQLTPTQVTALIEKNNIFADCGAVTECKYKNMATWKDTQ